MVAVCQHTAYPYMMYQTFEPAYMDCSQGRIAAVLAFGTSVPVVAVDTMADS